MATSAPSSCPPVGWDLATWQSMRQSVAFRVPPLLSISRSGPCWQDKAGLGRCVPQPDSGVWVSVYELEEPGYIWSHLAMVSCPLDLRARDLGCPHLVGMLCFKFITGDRTADMSPKNNFLEAHELCVKSVQSEDWSSKPESQVPGYLECPGCFFDGGMLFFPSLPPPSFS